jgi:hypothetical protein
MIASSSTVVTAMRTCPPGGENFTALSRMLARATFAAIGAAFTSTFGRRSVTAHSPLFGPRPHGDHGGVDQIADRDRLGRLVLRAGVDARQLESALDTTEQLNGSGRQARRKRRLLRDRAREAVLLGQPESTKVNDGAWAAESPMPRFIFAI